MSEEARILRESLCKLQKEKKCLQEIWSGITVNNSWETLLVHAPHSIAALEKLTALAVTSPAQISISLPSTYSLSEFKDDKRSDDLKKHVVQSVNEGRAAHEAAHKAMLLVSHLMSQIPGVIHRILQLLDQGSSEYLRLQLPGLVKELQGIVEQAADAAFSLPRAFRKANELISDSSSGIGRVGFMLLNEVKQFWSAVIAFCGEVSKLIEYTLDSSCNALVGVLMRQFNAASKVTKFSLKSRAREEIYGSSLATIAYALSVRHLADAYLHYSRTFVLPQLTCIARIPLIAHSEIELAKAQQQFKENNAASTSEMHRVLKTSRAVDKRRSILELDMGLELHLSEIATDLDAFLTPLADFRKGETKKVVKKISITGRDERHLSSPTGSLDSPTMFGRLRSSFTRPKSAPSSPLEAAKS